MKVLQATVLVLFIVLEDTLCVSASDILIFTNEYYEDRFSPHDWKSSGDVEQGQTSRLHCIVKRDRVRDFRIRDIRSEDPFKNVKYNYTTGEIFYQLGETTCDVMGRYVCEDDLGDRKYTDLGVFGCAPTLCDQNEKPEKIIHISDGDSQEFPFCVVGFPKLSNRGRLDSNLLRAKRSHTDDSSPFSWSMERHPDRFSAYNIQVHLRNITSHGCGEHSLTLYTEHKRHHVFQYKIVVTGPPECPRNLKAKVDEETATLSWDPGSDFGLPQRFQVFCKNRNLSWMLLSDTTDNYVIVSDLTEWPQYHFKVVAYNQYTAEDAGRCDNETVFVAKESKSARLSKQSHEPTISYDQSRNSATLVGISQPFLATAISAGFLFLFHI